MIAYAYIFGTILFTVYGQIILKWRLTQLNFELSEGFVNKILQLFKVVFDPFIFSGFASAFVASLFWMAAMSKMEITKAYPFMSLAPGLVFLVSVYFLDEEFTWGKVIGLGLIALGTLVTVKF